MFDNYATAFETEGQQGEFWCASERDRAIRSRLRRKRSRERPGPRRCDVLVAVSQREGEANRIETRRVEYRLGWCR